MVDKIKGARLDPNAINEHTRQMKQNINNLEDHFNALVEELREKNVL